MNIMSPGDRYGSQRTLFCCHKERAFLLKANMDQRLCISRAIAEKAPAMGGTASANGAALSIGFGDQPLPQGYPLCPAVLTNTELLSMITLA